MTKSGQKRKTPLTIIAISQEYAKDRMNIKDFVELKSTISCAPDLTYEEKSLVSPR